MAEAQTVAMKVTLIGAGNLATNLGKALYGVGHDVVEVYSRTMASAEALAVRLGSRATTDLAAINHESDVYILAVKDSALEEVIETLTSCEVRRTGFDVRDAGREVHNPVFLHTAGSVPMSIFEGHCQHYGVLYPMQTFSKDKEVDFSEIPIFIEGNGETALRCSMTLAKSISMRVHECTSEQRKHLHLAAVFACNFVNHCYALSARLLERQGIPFEVMLPHRRDSA